jgi:porin
MSTPQAARQDSPGPASFPARRLFRRERSPLRPSLALVLFFGLIPADPTIFGQTPPPPVTQGITPPTTGNTSPPKTFWTQDYLTQEWLGFRDQGLKDGISFKPDWTGEVLGNPSGGAKQGVISDGVFELPLELDLDKLTGGALKDTLFHVNAFYIYGPSLSSSFVHDFSTASNLSGYNTLRLDELWIQKGLWNNAVTVKTGNMAIDNEFFVSTSGALFIGGSFGTFTFLANNIPDAPVYPLASPGVRIHVQPDSHYYVMAGVYGLDDGSFQNTNNQNGTRFSLNASSGMLIMSEVGFLLNQGPNDKGLPGSYRLGSFVDTGNFRTFESQREITLPLDIPQGGRGGAGATYAVYGVVDQQLYAQGPKIISFFTRDGGAPTNTNFVDFYAEGGFDFTGFIPGRDNDVAGVAIARSHVSQDYSVEQIAESKPPSSAETFLEATYKIQLTPWWNLQPDVQYIVTPSGVAGSHNALVLGLRTYVIF